MANPKYSLLIIDDEWGTRGDLYKKTLGAEFDLEFVTAEQDIEEATHQRYDGYILDLVLGPDWSIKSSTVLNEYMDSETPTFLLSGMWETETNLIGLLRETVVGKSCILGLLDWSDFQSTKDYARKNIIVEIRVALDKWYRRERRPPRQAEEITILHLSDCQMRDPNTTALAHGAEYHLQSALENEGGGADLVVVSGDVAYSGSPIEYQKAEEWLDKVLTLSLGESFTGDIRERLLLVPGNHDVDLRILGADILNYDFGLQQEGRLPVSVEEVIEKGRREKEEIDEGVFPRARYGLHAYELFAEKATTYAREQVSDGVYVQRFLNWGIDIVLVSSVGLVTLFEPSAVGVTTEIMNSIENELPKKRDGQRPFRILVTHHPPPEILNAHPAEKAKWLEEPWDAFRSWVARLRPDLWLSGHTHAGDAYSLSANSGKLGLPCVVCPTLTLKQGERGEDAMRGFCILKLHVESGSVSKATVKIYELRRSGEPTLHIEREFDRSPT